MKNPNIETQVVHSQSKSAWNVIGTRLGGKYKIARVPYGCCDHEGITDRNREEALNKKQHDLDLEILMMCC